MVYVNKMDIMGANFFRVVQMLHDRLHANAVPIQLPIGSESDFRGIIDLITMRAEIYSTIWARMCATRTSPPSSWIRPRSTTTRWSKRSASWTTTWPRSSSWARSRRPTRSAHDPQGHHRVPLLPGDVRHLVPQQGRAAMLDNVVAYMPSPVDIRPSRA